MDWADFKQNLNPELPGYTTTMPYTFRSGDLPRLELDTDRGTDFLAWKEQWEAYRTLSGLNGEVAATQVQALKLCFSRETLTVVNNLGLTAVQAASQEQTITALQQHVEGLINESLERRHFRQRKQHSGESFDDYIVALRGARQDL